MKVNYTATEIREKCQQLESEDQKEQTVGIFFFSKHSQYLTA